MKTIRGITCAIAATVLLLGLQCISPVSNNGSGSTTETALVRGILYQADGTTPAMGVRVHIRPKKSLADTSTLLSAGTSGTGLSKRAAVFAATDSVVTDSAGRYAFDTTLDTGTYVIEAASGNNAVLIDSVPITNKTLPDTLPPDTLKPAGAIKGIIRLSEGGDPRKVFVLAFGIDRFAKVSIDGSFKFSGLAEAKYDLRLISSLDNYGVLDTVGVPVRSADTTDLDTISLPFTGIPTPKNVMITYDTLKQIVTLTWTMADTALVKSYNVYRRNVDSNTVFVRINTSPVVDTVYKDSTGLQGTTYEYMVAAVNKSTTEGTKSAAVSVKVVGAYTLIDSIGAGLGSQNGQFTYITGITCLSNGNIVALDYNQNFAQVFDSAGNFLLRFGQAGSSSAQFENPIAITNDDSDNIYILDQNGVGRVQEFSKNGIFTKSWTVGQNCNGLSYSHQTLFVTTASPRCFKSINIVSDSITQFNLPAYYPFDIDFDNITKSLFMVDYLGNRIIQMDTVGHILNSFGSKGNALGQFNSPRHLKISPRGDIYVANENGNSIQVFKATGEFIAAFGTGKITDPQGIAFDAFNNVYVSDGTLNYVLKFKGI
jgi:hypothetical protein